MPQLAKIPLKRYLGISQKMGESIYQAEDKILAIIENTSNLKRAHNQLLVLAQDQNEFVLTEILGPEISSLPTGFGFFSLVEEERLEGKWMHLDSLGLKTEYLDKKEYISGIEIKRTLDQGSKFRLEYRNVFYKTQLLIPFMEVVYQRKIPGT